MHVRIEKDIEACRVLWHRWSPMQSLFHVWEFRFPFWEEYRYEMAFVVLSQDGDDRGLLPLWRHPSHGTYLWFGDVGDDFNWQEDNGIWTDDPSLVPTLVNGSPRPLRLTSLRSEAAELLSHYGAVTAMNVKSILPLPAGFTPETYIAKLHGTSFRHMIRRNLRRVQERHPEILINDPRAFDSFLVLNTATFTDSPFADERLANVFRRLVRHDGPRPFAIRTISVEVGGVIVGAYCMFQYAKTSYALLYGGAKEDVPGIGHFIHFAVVADALATGQEVIDFGETDPGTAKERLFPTEPQWVFSLPLSAPQR